MQEGLQPDGVRLSGERAHGLAHQEAERLFLSRLKAFHGVRMLDQHGCHRFDQQAVIVDLSQVLGFDIRLHRHVRL